MRNKKTVQQCSAPQGEKMIEIKVRFWTNEIAETEGMILPKHAWARGVVRMERNDSHDIVPEKPKPFNSLMELSSVIETVLINHEITLHPSPKIEKYFALDE